MTSTSFKKATDTAVDGTNVKYGAPDLKYAFDVMDGTHTTDRLQIQNIEATEKITGPANWIIRKNASNNNIYEAVRADTGAVYYSIGPTSPDCLSVIDNILLAENPLFHDGDVILIKPSSTPYLCASISTDAKFYKSAVIIGYGATLQANFNRPANAMLRIMTAGKRLTLYGLTMDGNYPTNQHRGFIKGENSVAIDGIYCYDCVFKNLYDYGILAGLAAAGGTPEEPDIHEPGTPMNSVHMLFENCKFLGYRDPGTGLPTTQPKNNMMGCDGIESITIRNCYFDFNKYWYISARRVLIENVVGKSTDFSNVPEHAIHSEFLTIRNFTSVDSGIKVRNFGDIHMNFLFATNKHVLIDGYRHIGGGIALAIEPFDTTTYRMENVTLRNLNFGSSTGGVRVFNFDDLGAAVPKARVDLLSVENAIQTGFDSNNSYLRIRNCDAGSVRMKNIKFNTSFASSGASLVRVAGVNYAVTVDDIDISDVSGTAPNTLPPNQVLTAEIQNNVVATVRRPMDNGVNTFNTVGSGGTADVKFLENSGVTSTFNATTTTVTHNLRYTPALQDISITPTTDLGSATKFWISNPTSTQFTINVSPTPGQSIAFAWSVIRS